MRFAEDHSGLVLTACGVLVLVLLLLLVDYQDASCTKTCAPARSLTKYRHHWVSDCFCKTATGWELRE